MNIAAARAVRPRRLTDHWHAARVRLSPGWLCFVICLVPYLAAAAFVSLSFNALLGDDGVSRVEIASRILFSADPHLGAIGFVWSPIPVLAMLPLVAAKPALPVLVTQALAGTIVSAVFMSGAVAQVLGLLRDVGTGRRLRWALTALFALHPMIVLYAANAMSEAGFIFFLLLVARALNRWLRTRESGALVATGFYLALAYLTRYEAAAAALAGTGVVVLTTFLTSRGQLRLRLRLTMLDALIVVAPFTAAFAAWAGFSWVITGTPFAQFSSNYGNAEQVAAIGLHPPQTLSTLLANVGQALHWMVGLEPFLPLVVLACLGVIIRRRDWAALGAPAVLAAVLAYLFFASVTEQVPPQLRFYIVEIPLVLLMLGIIVGHRDVTASSTAAAPEPAPPTRRAHSLIGVLCPAVRRRAIAMGALLVMGLTIPLGFQIVANPAVDGSFATGLQALMNRGPLTPTERAVELQFAPDRAVSAYMDSLHLPRESVLIDDFDGFVVIMSSSHPDQYVITSDVDFQQDLADPAAAGIAYVLIPQPTGLVQLDAVNRAYPQAYANGTGIGTLVKTFAGDKEWRLYRVVGAS
ncbi:MAG: hypothetical protein ABR950_09460 [Candidatus Dormibacteria bacterium]